MPHADSMPTDALDHADACELCALATEEQRARQAAMNALAEEPILISVSPRTDGSLYGAVPSGDTAAFPTSVLRPRSTAQPEQEASQAPDESEREPKPERPRRSRKPFVIGAVAALLVVLAATTVFFSLGGFALFATVDVADVEAVLRADADFMDGFASDDYVEPSSYELADVEIQSEVPSDEGSKLVSVSAVLANRSFESHCALVLEFVRVRDLPAHEEFAGIAIPNDAADTDWVGRIDEAEAVTRALRGIDFDDEVSEEFSANFDDALQTCSFTTEDVQEFWFADITTTQERSYSFDGTAWVRDELPEPTVTVAYKGLEGAYEAGTGGASQFTMFKVTDLDETSGTFSIQYEKAASTINGDAIGGELACAISREDAASSYDEYRQPDGYVYAFEGTGTSDAGNGEARITGILTPDKSIVFDFEGDYTYKPFIFGEERPDVIKVSGSFARG